MFNLNIHHSTDFVQYFLYFLLAVQYPVFPAGLLFVYASDDDNSVMIVDKTQAVIMTPRSTTWLAKPAVILSSPLQNRPPLWWLQMAKPITQCPHNHSAGWE